MTWLPEEPVDTDFIVVTRDDRAPVPNRLTRRDPLTRLLTRRDGSASRLAWAWIGLRGWERG